MKILPFLLVAIIPVAQLFATDTTTFRHPERYVAATAYHLQQLALQPQSAYHAHQAACYSALRQLPDSMLRLSLIALRNGDQPEALMADTDFNHLHATPQWRTLTDTIRAMLLRRNQGITHPELAWELWLMGVDDQRPRTLYRYHKSGGNPTDNGYEQRVQRMEAIVKQHGWPTFSMVGRDAARAAFLIVQHSNLIATCLPRLIEAAMAGESELQHAAMMIDRHLCMHDHGQIYGTQFIRAHTFDPESKTMRLGDSSTPHPIAEFEWLSARRKHVGLIPFEEACVQHQAQLCDVKNAGRIRRRWIRRGYLLGMSKPRE
ncbi:MAG: hypothetical protein IJU72_05570 [Bacteroidales bacterium]|nr:hypothetical protein [Bacteroidales bacterium]